MTRATDDDRPKPTTDQPATTDQPTAADSAPEEPASDDARNESTPSTMGEISHRNPFTGETAGHFLVRGPIVRTDGGEETSDSTDAIDETAADSGGDPDGDTETDEHAPKMRDVDHTPPKDAADANRVFERGGRESIVESEE